LLETSSQLSTVSSNVHCGQTQLTHTVNWLTTWCSAQSAQSNTYILVCNEPPRSTQPGHPFVGMCNEYQPKGGDALRLSVTAGMVHVWVAGKTVSSPCYTRPIPEHFRDKGLI